MRKSWETAARVSASSSGHQVTPAAAGRDQCHLLPYFFCSHFIIGFLKNSKRIQSKWVNITFPPALLKGEDCSQYLLLLQLNTMLIHVWEKTSTPLSNLPSHFARKSVLQWCSIVVVTFLEPAVSFGVYTLMLRQSSSPAC